MNKSEKLLPIHKLLHLFDEGFISWVNLIIIQVKLFYILYIVVVLRRSTYTKISNVLLRKYVVVFFLRIKVVLKYASQTLQEQYNKASSAVLNHTIKTIQSLKKVSTADTLCTRWTQMREISCTVRKGQNTTIL